MERVFKSELIYKGVEVLCFLHKYQHNNKDAIVVYDKSNMSPRFTGTICTDDVLEEGLVVIKDYSENKGVYKWLLENDIIGETINSIKVGYVVCPIGRIKYENFEEADIDDYV